MILFLSTQDSQTSRSRTLINFLEYDLKVSFGTIIVTKYAFLSSFYEVFKFIKLNKPQKVIIGYNSRLLVVHVYILKLFYGFKVVYDLGYPISDIPKLFFVRRIIYFIADYLLIRVSTVVIVESLEQKLFVESRIGIPAIIYFASLDYARPLQVERYFDFKYFLFRGRLNYESGILTWISEFIKYKTYGSYKLVILGYGDLEAEVKNLIKNNLSDIVFISRHVDESELISIISNASCLLGQLNSQEGRLQKTIPHKFFEAVCFRKVYLGYLYPPVRTIIGDIYYDIGLQLDPVEPVSRISGLFWNFEKIEESSLTVYTERTYNLFLNQHNENKRRLNKCLCE